MRIGRIIQEIEERNKADPCNQLKNLLDWISEGRNKDARDRTAYFKKYYLTSNKKKNLKGNRK
jgi:hypothetical protein